ncbi:hypothetical protein D9757_005919 [Collybiopsis confluens]|uniref:Glycoside hydrolase family 92 protein n=1 Tax=Collybiopsis confluens TaxID=2823264 RepID=A0A8H5HNF4_9AGAR|nr:hypothetical protein D9757_005919 [Collybiopsis confluens]
MAALEFVLLWGSLSTGLAYQWPKTLLSSINPLIGSGGPEPNLSGGMIPSVGPPFASTRWVAQNQANYVSATPFNYTELYATNGSVHGFQGTRQPAIWMGESAWAAIVPGMTSGSPEDIIITDFDARGLPKIPGTETFGVALYSVGLTFPKFGGSTVNVLMSASSRVGHLQFTFEKGPEDSSAPYLFLPTTRPTTIFHNPNIFETIYPNGTVQISPENNEICGSNTEMQDWIIAPDSTKEAASHFTGWYCARFDTPFPIYGVTQGNTISEKANSGSGEEIGAYAQFEFPTQSNTVTINVRIGTSLISADQARYNLDAETSSFDISKTRVATENAWAEKIGRFQVETDGSSAADSNKTVFLTGVFHAMQYPYEVHEPTLGTPRYFSAYDNAIHDGESYSGYSIWDTYRAEWALTLLLAPERVPGMVRSMLQDYEEGGWLPMWKNMIETNIMVGTHADSLLAEAVLKGFGGGESGSGDIQPTFTAKELTTIWEAAWKDASVPPHGDDSGVDYEVRAGLSTFFAEKASGKGWVANDIHSESVSRTLDYAYDDHAVAVLSTRLPSHIVEAHTPNLLQLQAQFYGDSLKQNNVTTFLNDRALINPWTVWNTTASSPAVVTGGEDIKGFVQARQRDGSWAAPTDGFTEGDRWVYSFAFVHDIGELVKKRGGNESFSKSLDEFFDGGWVDFTNEPAHHTPYLYALAGAATYTQERVREMAYINYNNTPNGLSGNEDCGQMSAWYVFSAMGFYPVNPVSVNLPVPPFIPPSHWSIAKNQYYDQSTKSYVLRIRAPGAETKPYVRSLRINGRVVEAWEEPLISHDEIRYGGMLEFEMSETAENWGGGRGAWTRNVTDYASPSAFHLNGNVEHVEL